MTYITTTQKRQLRGSAHSLKPVVILGDKGLTDNVLEEINRALDDHELIKIRINAADKAQRQQITQDICEKTQAQLIHTIGHIIAIYRENTDEVTS